MPSLLRNAWLLFAAGFCLLMGPAVSAERLYVNSFASDWGIWARGHCVLHDDGGRYRLEIEALDLEPNRSYPQTYEVSGFRLAYSYRDKGSGALAGDAGQSGLLTAHPLHLPPGETRTVTGLVLEVPRGRPPRAGEVLLLELHIVTGRGGYFTVAVGEFEGG